MNISLNDRRVEEVDTYRYLGVDIPNDGGMSEEVNHRITEAKKAWGALKDLWVKRHMSREAKVSKKKKKKNGGFSFGVSSILILLNYSN